MSNAMQWRVLVIDDEETVCRQVKEYLEGESLSANLEDTLQVDCQTRFADALQTLEANRYDLVILDVRLTSMDVESDDEAGVKTLNEIKRRRFLPVLFYTGLPNKVSHLKSRLIRVVEKTEGLSRLLEEAKDIFDTRLPVVNRALISHLEAVQRDYMWDFVDQHWSEFGETEDRTALAYLLARRLATSLSGPGIRQLAQDLGDTSEAATSSNQVHPVRYYIMPPVETSPMAGDIYARCISEGLDYWVLLTPSCDLAQNNAERVLMAHCIPLADAGECISWRDSKSKTKEALLRSLLKNNRKEQADRFHFLPGVFSLPDLLVDFQQLQSLSTPRIGTWQRLASLDSPFAEALLSRFTRYFGRLGTPDLNLDAIVNRLRGKDKPDLTG